VKSKDFLSTNAWEYNALRDTGNFLRAPSGSKPCLDKRGSTVSNYLQDPA